MAKTIQGGKSRILFVGFGITIFILFLSLMHFDFIDILENKTYDLRVRNNQIRTPNKEIVIVAIDEKSIKRLGRWPWSRRVISDLLERINQAGAKVVFIDAIFSEPENARILKQIESIEARLKTKQKQSPYQRIKKVLTTDLVLSQSIKQGNNVVLGMVFYFDDDQFRHLSQREKAIAVRTIKQHAFKAVQYRGKPDNKIYRSQPKGVLTNIPSYSRSARWTGHINIFPDSDGVIRQAPLVMKYGNDYYPSADIKIVQAYKNVDAPILRIDTNGIEGIQIGNQFVPTDDSGRVLINYRGPAQTFSTLSAIDVLNGRIDKKTIQNKIILIGITAAALGDVYLTPYHPAFPGIEIHANIVSNLLENNFIQRPELDALLNATALLLLGSILTLLLPRLSMTGNIVVVLTLALIYIFTANYAFNEHRIWINVFYPGFLIVSLFIATTLSKYFLAEAEKRKIKSAFQHYVSPAIVDEITNNVDGLKLGGEKRELTVLFSDLRGFTALSEKTPPEQLVEFLNDYLSEMTTIVFKYKGMLDKYIGDAIMAVYGAPIATADHAKLACRTALEMIWKLDSFQTKCEIYGIGKLEIGIGISTGPMIVGNMGSKELFDFTVIGDAVNLGSRIEQLNKLYGTSILMSEYTYELIKDDYTNIRKIDTAPIRGRAEKAVIYELMPPGAYTGFDWLEDYNRAYGLFHHQKYREAEQIFQRLDIDYKDTVSRYYLKRIAKKYPSN